MKYIQIILILSSFIMMINSKKLLTKMTNNNNNNNNIASIRGQRSIPLLSSYVPLKNFNDNQHNNHNNRNHQQFASQSTSSLPLPLVTYRPFMTPTPAAASTLIPAYYISNYPNLYPFQLYNLQSKPIALYQQPLLASGAVIRFANNYHPPTTFPAYFNTQNYYPSNIRTSPPLINTEQQNAKMFQKRIDMNDNKETIPCKTISSETYPVYVLPPKDFQPIIYQQPSSLASFFTSLPLIYHHHNHNHHQQQLQQIQENKLEKIPHEILHDLDNNNNNNNNYESEDYKTPTTKTSSAMTSEEQILEKNKITLMPVDDVNFDNLPLFEASSTKKSKSTSTVKPVKRKNANDTNNKNNNSILNDVASNPYNFEKSDDSNNNKDNLADILMNDGNSKKNNYDVDDEKSRKTTFDINKDNNNNNTNNTDYTRKPYKTKLPVGLTSFLFGGTRGVSGRHWNLPKTLQQQLEFMPNLLANSSSPIVMTNEYYPDDESLSLSSTSTKNTDDFIDKNLNKEIEDENFDDHTNQFNNLNNILENDEDLLAEESKSSIVTSLQMPEMVMLSL